LVYVEQNAGKIVGAVVAEPQSWPATAFITFEYKTDITIDGIKLTKPFSSLCGGSICFIKSFS
jgi:hypothetical protein